MLLIISLTFVVFTGGNSTGTGSTVIFFIHIIYAVVNLIYAMIAVAVYSALIIGILCCLLMITFLLMNVIVMSSSNNSSSSGGGSRGGGSQIKNSYY